jgi:seryl-tRNA synthetase
VQQETDAPSAGTQQSDDRPLFRAYIDFKYVKSNLDIVRENVKVRNSSADPDAVARLYDEWVELLEAAQRLQEARNRNAKALKV